MNNQTGSSLDVTVKDRQCNVALPFGKRIIFNRQGLNVVVMHFHKYMYIHMFVCMRKYACIRVTFAKSFAAHTSISVSSMPFQLLSLLLNDNSIGMFAK